MNNGFPKCSLVPETRLPVLSKNMEANIRVLCRFRPRLGNESHQDECFELDDVQGMVKPTVSFFYIEARRD